jgi:chemotaxis protein histidine kinase CheA
MESRWLTYDEMAAVLRMTPASARRLVGKKKWPRKMGNDGRALICVPPERLAAAALPAAEEGAGEAAGADAGTGTGGDAGTDAAPVRIEAELLARLERLQAEMVEMAQRLGASENRAAAAEAVAGELRQDRDAWRVQAEVAQEQVQEALRQLAETRRELAERLTERRPGLIERIAAVLRRAG